MIEHTPLRPLPAPRAAHLLDQAQLQSLTHHLTFGQLVAATCFVGLRLQHASSAAQQHWYEVLVREIARRSR